jgi:hypothetical protein
MGNPISGATNNTLQLPLLQISDAGAYRVAVSDGFGFMLSAEAMLQVDSADASNPFPRWHPIGSSPLAAAPGIAHGNGRYVAVGDAGGIIDSIDGVDWTKQLPVTTENLNSIAFGEGRFGTLNLAFAHDLFVADGPTGALFTSKDARNWTLHQQKQSLPAWPNSLVWAEGRYFTANGGPGLAISSDAVDWQFVQATNSFSSLAYGNGTVVAARSDDTLFISTDSGIRWAEQQMHFDYGGATPNLYQVAFGGGVFVASGSLNYNNLLHWETVGTVDDAEFSTNFEVPDAAAHPAQFYRVWTE